LVLKIFLVPLIIGFITLLGRRFGPTVAGVVAGFPVVAGPLLLFIALEQGVSFAADSAMGVLGVTMGNVAFCLSYAWLATRFPWWLCLAGGYVVFCLVAWGVAHMTLGPAPLFALVIGTIIAGSQLFPRNIDPRPLAPPPKMELPVRMISSAILILLVTYFASQLGPRLSGIVATPPLLASVLAGFSHPVSGAGFAIKLVQGMVSGFYALASFCFALVLLLPALPLALAFFLS